MIEASIYSKAEFNADHYVVNGDTIYIFSSEDSGNRLVETLVWKSGKLYRPDNTERGYYKVSMRN
mgnify:FL=1